MPKNIDSAFLMTMPSGNKIHPSRLIVKDGIFSWKHACSSPPMCVAHEAHIEKTAQRLEELNSWIQADFEPWESLKAISWYDPSVPELSEGISLYFTHCVLDPIDTYELLKNHILDHETLQLRNQYIFFKRC
tara:strand:+ start:2668 stop:3063 length:396 start_codon:yes stop_codon:yes gene_type:complete